MMEMANIVEIKDLKKSYENGNIKIWKKRTDLVSSEAKLSR